MNNTRRCIAHPAAIVTVTTPLGALGAVRRQRDPQVEDRRRRPRDVAVHRADDVTCFPWRSPRLPRVFGL